MNHDLITSMFLWKVTKSASPEETLTALFSERCGSLTVKRTELSDPSTGSKETWGAIQWDLLFGKATKQH